MFEIDTGDKKVMLSPQYNEATVLRHQAAEYNLEKFMCQKGFGVEKLTDINLDDPVMADRYKRILTNMVLACKSCKLSVETEFSHCAPIYVRNPIAVCIGRSPSRAEAKCNQIVASETQCGRVFDQYLHVLGLSRSDVAVLNAVQCHTRGNRPPESECVKKCSAFKKLEFYYINRFKILFLMGNDAVYWLYGRNHPGVLNVQGMVYNTMLRPEFLDLGIEQEVIVIPVVHPNHLVINPELRSSVSNILKVARQIIKQLD